MQEQARDNQNFLSIIGAVSLFVAAIGIANTMIMAIYERTREIGVMKVIGASLRDIKWLFLIESALIGLIGGMLGVGLSYLLSHALNTWDIAVFQQMFAYMDEQESSIVSVITPWLSGLALGFAAMVGLVSGYCPARRAMRLSALTAIRTE
jgi:ABC-type antimicrobial peptide transport system permease subunit